MRVAVSRRSTRASCPPARRSCSTRPSTSSPPAASSASARSSCSRSCWATTGCSSSAHADEERVSRSPKPWKAEPIRVGDALLLDSRSGFVYERIPKAEVEDLVLEEVPDIAYPRHRRPGRPDRADPRRRRAAVPAPRPVPRARAEGAEGRPAVRPAGLRQDADRQGRRRTRWPSRSREGPGKPERKSFFLNIKGPELLNKYVGETERHIRLIFARAREKASEGTPVVVFFDEMDSLFRTRGTGVSSDVENDDRPAAAQRDRRRRAARERHRDRRVQPRGHDRPGDPAAGPAGREDQDRAARRRGAARHLQQVPHRRPAVARERPRRARRTARRPSRR